MIIANILLEINNGFSVNMLTLCASQTSNEDSRLSFKKRASERDVTVRNAREMINVGKRNIHQIAEIEFENCIFSL